MAFHEQHDRYVQLVLITCTRKGVHLGFIEAADGLIPYILHSGATDTRRLASADVLGFQAFSALSSPASVGAMVAKS